MSEYRVLLILGEVLDENQKLGFQNDILGGLYSCPIKQLEQLAECAKHLPTDSTLSSTEDHVFSRACDNVTLKVICRPTCASLVSAITSFVKPHKDVSSTSVIFLIIYAGLMTETSASWVLPSVIFTPRSLVDLVELAIAESPKLLDAENQSTAAKPFHIHIGCAGVPSGGEWRQLVGHQFSNTIGGHPISVTVNKLHSLAKTKPSASGDSASPPTSNPPDLSQLIESILSEVPTPYYPLAAAGQSDGDLAGLTLQVPKPCLYVFPEGSGQASIFALPGYNLLINAGCSRSPTFLPVATRLERLDAILLTHWGVDNLLGVCSTLPSVFSSAPGRDATLCLLAPPPANHLEAPQSIENGSGPAPLCLNVPRRVSTCIGQLKRAGTNVVVHQLTRNAKLAAPSKPMQLYHKIGYGTLELFTLTPTEDDVAEIRKLSDDWSKAAPTFISSTVPLVKAAANVKVTVPLLSHTSVSALVVWRPASEFEPILRLLFVSPVAHQTRVITGLDAMSAAHLYLRHPKATAAPPPCETDRRRSTMAQAAITGPRRPLYPAASVTTKPSFQSSTKSRTNMTGGHTLPAAGHIRTSTTHPAGTQPKVNGAIKKTKPASTASNGSNFAVPAATTARKSSNAGNAGATNTPKAVTKPPPTSEVSPAAPLVKPASPDTQSLSLTEGINPSGEHHVNGIASEASPPRVDVAAQQLGSDAPPKVAYIPDIMDHMEDLHLVSKSLVHPISGEGDHATNAIADWGTPLGLPPPPGPPTAASHRNVSSRSDHPRSGHLSSRTTTSRSGVSGNHGPQGLLKGYTDASSYANVSASSKLAPYDRVKPVYVDVAYLPGGGNSHLVDAEFFKRVRARYYVATDARPSAALMESLVTGKESWTGEDAHLATSLILAHESSEVIPWLGCNTGRLSACHLSVDAVASRSGIQLSSQTGQQPITCPGYRIDF